MAIKFRVARLERARAAAQAPPTLTYYEADIAWTRRFVRWSPENAALAAETEALFARGRPRIASQSPLRARILFLGLAGESRLPQIHGLLRAADMDQREQIAEARRLFLRLHVLIAEYTEATGDRHPL